MKISIRKGLSKQIPSARTKCSVLVHNKFVREPNITTLIASK